VERMSSVLRSKGEKITRRRRRLPGRARRITMMKKRRKTLASWRTRPNTTSQELCLRLL